MSVSRNTRKVTWVPPPRPDWVSRINQEGEYLDLSGVVPLDKDSLIATATRNTGLTDFGSDEWREPFSILVKAYEDESRLTLIGRILTRTDLLMLLEARLRIEDAYKRHPEIEDEVIERPLWILGQGRSGTTILQTLLGLDPVNRVTYDWEALFPVASSGADADRRFEIAQQRITLWNRVTPELQAVHRFAADAPTEVIHFEAMSFRTPAWLNLFGLTPSFNGYIARQDYALSFAYAKRAFKFLQWQAGEKRQWVFKSPDSIGYLPELLRVFPDVRMVWAHRDPVKSLASAVDLVGVLSWVRSNQQHSQGTFDAVTDPVAVATSLLRPIEWIESGVIPRAQLCNLQYADLMRAPIETIAGLYDFYGMQFTEAARRSIADYLVAHPRSARPAHRYSVGAEDDIRAERAAFSRYQEYFGVSNEF